MEGITLPLGLGREQKEDPNLLTAPEDSSFNVVGIGSEELVNRLHHRGLSVLEQDELVERGHGQGVEVRVRPGRRFQFSNKSMGGYT